GLEMTAGCCRQTRHPLVNVDGGKDGTQRIIIMGGRRAENRHHVVTDMLVDSAAIGLDDAVDQLKVAVQQRMSLLGADLGRKAREACQVRDQNCALAALARRCFTRRRAAFRYRLRETRYSLEDRPTVSQSGDA